MKTALLLVCAALSAAAAGEAPVTASARLESGQLVVTARNVSDKKIAAYTLVVRGIDAAGRPGPTVAHTEVMEFSPQLRTGRHKDGWLPGESVTVQPRGSMHGPGGSVLEKFTVSCDYILFVDGSRWGPDGEQTAARIDGLRQGWQLAHTHLRSVLESGGVNAVKDELTQ